MTCGIYKIENKENGKVYIGSSKNIEKRWEAHEVGLKNKRHHNAKLQHAWNKAGGKLPLDYSVLEECSIEDLFVREQHWMDFYNSYSDGYNCTKLSQGCPNPVKTSVWIKTEPLLPEIFQNFYEFQLGMDDSHANKIYVSHFDLKLEKASSNTAYIKRLHKLSRMLINIRLELEGFEEGYEYRLHYIHYSGKDGGYELTRELNESKKSKYSAHNKVKRLNILSVLWDEVMESFTGRVGKGIKERYDLYLQGRDVDGE